MSRICIDPGHGGTDSGAVANGCIEKDLNLAIALELRPLLQAAGHTVIMTRTKDTDVSLRARGCLSVSRKADEFVSIHHDASSRTTAKGCHGFAHREYYKNGMDLATKVATAVHEDLGVPFSYGGPASDWFGKNLGVMRGCRNAFHVTAALVECLFLTNPREASLTKQPGYNQRAAVAIANGIQRHLGLPDVDAPPAQTEEWLIIEHGTDPPVEVASYQVVPNGCHPEQRKLYVVTEE